MREYQSRLKQYRNLDTVGEPTDAAEVLRQWRTDVPMWAKGALTREWRGEPRCVAMKKLVVRVPGKRKREGAEGRVDPVPKRGSMLAGIRTPKHRGKRSAEEGTTEPKPLPGGSYGATVRRTTEHAKEQGSRRQQSHAVRGTAIGDDGGLTQEKGGGAAGGIGHGF